MRSRRAPSRPFLLRGGPCAWAIALLLAAAPAFGGLDDITPPPPELAAGAYLLIDADSGRQLVAHNANEQLPPASLTKIMTSYIAGRELAAGHIDHDDEVIISVSAWQTPGSRSFVREGRRVRLEDLLRGMIIQSGNDATVAVAEHIAGSEEAFVDMMNQHARRLGMDSTHFRNATGLPAEGHVSTPADLAKVTRAMIQEFPEHYAYYSERSFTYNEIRQPNRNRLLWRDRSVDGVKTGHTEEAGYCLVASAEREGMRLISVVMRTSSDEARMRQSNRLLSYGFRNYETQRLYDALEELEVAEVWYGDSNEIALGVEEELYVTIQRGHYDDIRAVIELPSIVEAPVERGSELGRLRLQIDDELIHETALIALSEVQQAGFLKRLWHGTALFFRELLP